MSTYWTFGCKKCKEKGGFMGDTIGGAGGFDIIESFKFILYHTQRCQTESIFVMSEHEDIYFEYEEASNFLDKTKDIFPGSNDWEFMCKTLKNHNQEWINQFKEKTNEVEI